MYLPNLVSGKWTGTMCLTEAHCGSDLGLLRTKAEPQADGSYAITGTKIFISAGDHDMSDNIVHIVIARLPDAPEGTKGISLFVVPKYNVMGAAKAALEHGVRQLASELGPWNIRVNAISAGPVATLSARGISGFTGMAAHHRKHAPLRRDVERREVGDAAVGHFEARDSLGFKTVLGNDHGVGAGRHG